MGEKESKNDSESKAIKISKKDKQWIVDFGAEKINLNDEEFSLLREGTIPSAVQLIAEKYGITKDQLIHAAKNSKGYAESVIFVDISKLDGVSARIYNGPEGKISYIEQREKEPKETVLVRFSGEIGRVVRIDGHTLGVKMIFDSTEYVLSVSDALTLLGKRYSLSTSKRQMLTEVLEHYTVRSAETGDIEDYHSSPIYVSNENIHADWDVKDTAEGTLRTLREFMPSASHPTAFVAVFSSCLIAPLHDELKRRSVKQIQTPQTLLPGKTRGGKTTLGTLFIGKGYNLEKDAYFYPYNRVYTRFTLMNKLRETNLPALFDDLPTDWVFRNKEDLKSYVQTGHFGDRGRGDQTETQYRGMRSFIGTINDDFRPDDDLALSLRLLVLWFTEYNTQRKDKEKFDAMFDSLPSGFMFIVFREIFEGKDINDVLHTVERFESVADWVNYGIDEVNKLCVKYGIDPFPPYSEEQNTHGFSNALEIAQAFLEEWERIQTNTETYSEESGAIKEKTKYRSPIEGAFKAEYADGRMYIHFTPSAFETLVGRGYLHVPYSNATNFLNNIKSNDDVRVENEGKPHNVRIGNQPLRVYSISIRDGEVL